MWFLRNSIQIDGFCWWREQLRQQQHPVFCWIQWNHDLKDIDCHCCRTVPLNFQIVRGNCCTRCLARKSMMADLQLWVKLCKLLLEVSLQMWFTEEICLTVGVLFSWFEIGNTLHKSFACSFPVPLALCLFAMMLLAEYLWIPSSLTIVSICELSPSHQLTAICSSPIGAPLSPLMPSYSFLLQLIKGNNIFSLIHWNHFFSAPGVPLMKRKCIQYL